MDDTSCVHEHNSLQDLVGVALRGGEGYGVRETKLGSPLSHLDQHGVHWLCVYVFLEVHLHKLEDQVELHVLVDYALQPADETRRKRAVKKGGKAFLLAPGAGRRRASRFLKLRTASRSCYPYLTILGCCSSLRREISRMAVLGTPSSSDSSRIFFMATN